jgi:hypothetical protein
MRITTTLVLALVLGGCSASRGPTPLSPNAMDSGAFIVLLGNDTISAESYTRAGDRVEGTIVRRMPRTSVLRYVMTLAPSGLASRLEYNVRLPDGSMLPNGARSVTATFTADSVFTEILRDEPYTRRVAARNAYPEIDGAVSFNALPIAALKATGRDSASFVAYAPGASQGSESPVASRGSNRYWVYSFGNPTEVATDASGRILSVDGSRTTLRIQSRRQPPMDVAVLASGFLERERTSGPLVALSLRDSVIASVGGARISVGYGRPAARGRTVWGANGVLGDTLWRTGANQSTKFITDADISIGGGTLPAGTYSLMTLAVPGRYQLIFYARDTVVLRVPLQATALDPRVERFTIVVEPTGKRAGVLRLRWDALELSTPFSVISSP